MCVGHVPSQHQPAGSIRPENEADILWALKGAGTNFGIVVRVTFKAYTAPRYLVRSWIVPIKDGTEAQQRLRSFQTKISSKLDRNCSADAYLYQEDGRLRLGVTLITSTTTMPFSAECPFFEYICSVLGAEEDSADNVDSVGLFKKDMYVSKIHGGHGGGKTSSFKRCVFLKDTGCQRIAKRLVEAVEGQPSLCYLHLLQGGGAIGDIAVNASAFGCRDWDFACVITGVWPRDQDGTDVARAAVKWVYSVVENLLPISQGVYSADLGPDPRDAVLAYRAFGTNRERLAQLKLQLDPRNILAYTCPLPKTPLGPKLIFLVTGQSCAGKDYCADAWVSMLAKLDITTRAVSISEAIKREYAVATGADTSRLLSERAYKEQHRTALTAYFHDRMQHEPQLPQEQFLQVVNGVSNVGVLFITGVRDEAPVATFAPQVPHSRLVEVYVKASARERRLRKGDHIDDGNSVSQNASTPAESSSEIPSHQPCLIFNNESPGN